MYEDMIFIRIPYLNHFLTQKERKYRRNSSLSKDEIWKYCPKSRHVGNVLKFCITEKLKIAMGKKWRIYILNTFYKRNWGKCFVPIFTPASVKRLYFKPV